MTAITIRFFAQFRELLGERIQLVVPEATTITEAVQIVCRERKEAAEALFGEDGAFREYVILMQGPGTGRAGSRRDRPSPTGP